jgi:acyl carrier protein
MSDNETRLRGVVAKVLAMPAQQVSDATSMETVASWDSLKQLQVILALEEEFGVSFDEELALEIVSLPQIRAALGEQGVSF